MLTSIRISDSQDYKNCDQGVISSDLADMTNLGGSLGGAITAGKFLEHFMD